jgi:hypothetical protein
MTFILFKGPYCIKFVAEMIVTCFKVLSEYPWRGWELPGKGLKLQDFSHISSNTENKIIAPEEFKQPQNKSTKKIQPVSEFIS